VKRILDTKILVIDNIDTLAIIGTRERPGADEDDFHTYKRRKQEVDTETKSEAVKKKMLQAKTGAYSGIVKSFTSVPKPTKKVVFFGF
jgi:zinc finger CCHC domain-containing protein 9